ncbi:hypothetical protein TNCV_1712301 [Trichonephila clavipes]|nr:hypothetical protein TNCV_1712301 [Trichonephila clavipes]
MVSPAVQGQVRHPSIVPEFLRSTSCGMTSARGHGAIVYCLNSGSEERQTGRHNMLCEGDTRNRWRDGQVCADVLQGTRAPWARRLGREERSPGERTDGRRRERRRQRRRKRVRERERTEGERAESGIGVKKTMNAFGVENGI